MCGNTAPCWHVGMHIVSHKVNHDCENSVRSGVMIMSLLTEIHSVLNHESSNLSLVTTRDMFSTRTVSSQLSDVAELHLAMFDISRRYMGRVISALNGADEFGGFVCYGCCGHGRVSAIARRPLQFNELWFLDPTIRRCFP